MLSSGDARAAARETANWLTHLEVDWNSPCGGTGWRSWGGHAVDPIRRARLWPVRSRRGNLLRFRGRDMEAVVDARASSGSRFESHKGARSRSRTRFVIPGARQARLYGGYADRPEIPGHDAAARAGADAVDEPDSGRLGRDNPAFRQVFGTPLPDGTPEQHQWFNDLAKTMPMETRCVSARRRT